MGPLAFPRSSYIEDVDLVRPRDQYRFVPPEMTFSNIDLLALQNDGASVAIIQRVATDMRSLSVVLGNPT